LFCEVIEQELPPDGTRNAVVHRPRLLDSSPSHKETLEHPTLLGQIY